MSNSIRFRATNTKILELAAAATKNKKVQNLSTAISILQSIDSHFSSPAPTKCRPFLISPPSLFASIEKDLLENPIRSLDHSPSRLCSWYPPSTAPTNLTWNTALLLYSLAQRNNIVQTVEHSTSSESLASSLQTKLILSKLNSGMNDDSIKRDELLDWLSSGLQGIPNVALPTNSTQNDNDVESIVRRMIVPATIHAAFSSLLRVVTTEILEKHKIRHWAIGGTLLGAMRHRGEFIPYDDDADLAVAPEDDESEGEFDLRLRRALKLTASDILHQSEKGQTWFAEAAPLFGYKVFAGPELLFSTEQQQQQQHDMTDLIKSAPFGIFVDLFVLRKRVCGISNRNDETYYEFACEGARRTWPREGWKKFRNNQEPKRLSELLLHGKGDRVLPSCLHLPPSLEEAHEHLDAAFGTEWKQVCIVPRSSHGKTLPVDESVRFSLKDFEKWGF